MFLQLHHATSALLEEVSHWGETRPTFDMDNFKIDMEEESKAGSEEEEIDDIFDNDVDVMHSSAQVSSLDSLSHHYR